MLSQHSNLELDFFTFASSILGTVFVLYFALKVYFFLWPPGGVLIGCC